METLPDDVSGPRPRPEPWPEPKPEPRPETKPGPEPGPILRSDPIRATTEEARALARRLLAEARHGALGVLDPESRLPLVTRVAVGWDGAAALILVSTLALHARALLADPACSLLVGEPGPKGDPLTHPRLSLQARALPVDKAAGRAAWLSAHPKATLYYDFADFLLLRLDPFAAHLNGGFGQAFRLTPADLRDAPGGPMTSA